MMLDELGLDYKQDAVYFALENQKLTQRLRDEELRNMDLCSSLMDMMVAFDMLTREGGWDTMDDEMKNKMTTYRDKAKEVYLGK